MNYDHSSASILPRGGHNLRILPSVEQIIPVDPKCSVDSPIKNVLDKLMVLDKDQLMVV